MLPICTDNLYDPPSSPASSIEPTSSSPLSSPIIEPLSLESESENEDDRPVLRVTDPFAGSYGLKTINKAKRATPVLIPYASPSKKRRTNMYPPVLDESEDEGTSHSATTWSAIQSPVDADTRLWDGAIENAFQSGQRRIELTDTNLTRIPAQIISDLAKFTVLPAPRKTLDDARLSMSTYRSTSEAPRRKFSRVQTAPASSTGIEWGASTSANTGRQKSSSSSSVLSSSSPDIELFLGNNAISNLPTELWNLKNLTILSLRNNMITYLPSEVSKLENLVELNVANNELTFLPSELLSMETLRNLIVNCNPYIPRPQLPRAPVSETYQVGSVVPSLSELALRALHLPAKSHERSRAVTIFEDAYELPIPTGPPYRLISEPLRHVLAICVPGSVATNDYGHSKSYASSSILDSDSSFRAWPVTGIGRCPNPEHTLESTSSIFVQHVEERYTWVDSISGIKLGGFAPLRWRGCERGCLRFLDPPEPEPREEEVEDESTVTVEQNGEVADGEGVIQAIRFEAAALDFDEE
ncbi:hypothetical protein CPB83DRAFT_848741 [Crepidotus variabilis]|uniref:Uncharacterized protein n=1 Tax=Crepidotus variabilis TaxID=179855 RepID=A0A9P6EMV5_9AGAR|nr:hypothetical protein CPB83DRAFT_848741 [Crepidotus variabilis]